MEVYRVLVIDDREAHADGLAELLTVSGFDAHYALTGIDGLRQARAFNVHAILLDLHLPDMTGFEVCRALRADPATTNIAVVFHTADSTAGIADGADAFLTYPVDIAHLSSVLRGCIARRPRPY